MGKLIDTLLALTRADAGAEHSHLEVIDLNDLVRDAARKWAPQMLRSSIIYTAINAPDAARILGDRMSLKRLLDILIDNAWRYTSQGGAVSVTVSCDDRHVTLAVRDTGIGISPDDQPRIFERFYRAARPQNGEHAGSGLGLALARWIAEKHSATIDVVSAMGQGSCFSSSFDCVRDSDSATTESSSRNEFRVEELLTYKPGPRAESANQSAFSALGRVMHDISVGWLLTLLSEWLHATP